MEPIINWCLGLTNTHSWSILTLHARLSLHNCANKQIYMIENIGQGYLRAFNHWFACFGLQHPVTERNWCWITCTDARTSFQVDSRQVPGGYNEVPLRWNYSFFFRARKSVSWSTLSTRLPKFVSQNTPKFSPPFGRLFVGKTCFCFKNVSQNPQKNRRPSGGIDHGSIRTFKVSLKT